MHRVIALFVLLLAMPVAAEAPPTMTSPPDAAALAKMTARYAPVDLTADLSGLAPDERRALAALVEAARVMDSLFLHQVWEGNDTLLLKLLADETPLGRARLRHFLLNKGPWSRLDHDRAFLAGVPDKP